MSDLILPVGLRPIIQNFNETHLRFLTRLDMITGLIASLRAMPLDQFGTPTMMPVLTMHLGTAVEVLGILSACMTLQSAEADQLMQESPGTFSIDGAVAQAMPLLLWVSHGITTTVRASVGVIRPATPVLIGLTQNRHTLERTCDAVETMLAQLRQRFPGQIPTPQGGQ